MGISHFVLTLAKNRDVRRRNRKFEIVVSGCAFDNDFDGVAVMASIMGRQFLLERMCHRSFDIPVFVEGSVIFLYIFVFDCERIVSGFRILVVEFCYFFLELISDLHVVEHFAILGFGVTEKKR